jgi:mono/diheme cytochrome c family protein
LIRPTPHLRIAFALLFACAGLALAGCNTQLRKSDAELGLNAQQAAGRKVYNQYCDRCHEPYSSRGKKGPSLQGLFKRQFMRKSSLPATNERVNEIVLYGRSTMPGFGQVLSQAQVQDLLAYLHTL